MDLVFLPLSLLSSAILDDSPSSVLVYPSPKVSLLDLGDFSSFSKYLMDSLGLLKIYTISFLSLSHFIVHFASSVWRSQCP